MGGKFTIKLFVGVFLIFFALTFPASAANITDFNAKIFQNRLDKYKNIRVYNVEGEDCVPYVSAQEYLTFLYDDKISFNFENNSLVATRNDKNVIFDSTTSKIRCDNWDYFFGSHGDRALPNGILNPTEFNAKKVSKIHQSTETADINFEVDLNSYGLKLIAHDEKILVPFAVLQNIFAVPKYENDFSFNGNDFYDIGTPIANIYGHYSNPNIKLNPYSTAYYSGSFSQENKIPEAYVRYAYGTTCLLFDLYYGHKAEKGIENFDKYFEENGLKEKFLSTDTEENSEAFLDLVYKLFDSGHDSVTLSYSVFNTNDYITTAKVITAYGGMQSAVEALQKISYKVSDMGVNFLADETGNYEQYNLACRELKLDPVILEYIFRDDNRQLNEDFLYLAKEMAKIRGKNENEFKIDMYPGNSRSAEWNKLKETVKHISDLKPKDFGTSRVDIIDDTAFIYFEHFMENDDIESSFYVALPDENIYDESTFGLFYDAFEKIKQNSQVKKVVIDLSNNGGGHVGALTAILGFLSPDGEVNLTYSHTLNQNYCSEWYHVDTNLDGKFDSRDGFGGQYDFYILTSGFSYSCANALPFYAQLDGLAKIIGEQPGGGDCMVAPFLDAYGHVASMSGWCKFSRMIDGQIISDEHAVKIDYPFGNDADKLYFNYKNIADWLKKKTESH